MIVFDEDGPGPMPECLFVGGDFNNVGALQAKGVARWNGTAWSTVGNAARPVYAFATYDDGTGPALYAAGAFDLSPNTPTNVAKWNGTAWQPLGAASWGQ
jgi:hypothetical protein